MRVLFSIFFGLIRTPALIYFVGTGFLVWIALSLFNIVTFPIRYILERIGGSKSLGHIAGLVTFMVLYRAMYESIVAIYLFVFRVPDLTPYPLLMRIYLEQKASGFGFGALIPYDMNFPFDFIPRFTSLVQDSNTIGVLLNSEFYVADLMVGWIFLLGLWGIWIARAVRHTLSIARLD